ncbi:MAG TPA: transporter substrate-binding domain-containing protein [Devosia sp.]|nr:transporter substrate-binding domain-containing protein [Devosia sp.]
MLKNFIKVLGMVAVAAPLFATSASADTIDDIRARGTLRIPAIVNEAPYFNKDPRTNEWTGLVIDLANDIAKVLDVKLEIVESTWGNSILDVQSGKVDMAFAATATPERSLAVSFSDPTYYNSFVIISADEKVNGKSWAELNSPDYTFAVDIGSSQDLITYKFLPNANILRFQTRDEAIVAATTGKADGLVNTLFNGLVMSKRTPTLGRVLVPTPTLSTPSSIALNYETDERWKTFVSTWANYNRRIGNIQTMFMNNLAPFGIVASDLPAGYSFSE